jgi:hypothetical protein
VAQYDVIGADLVIRYAKPCLAVTFEGMADTGIASVGFAAYESPIGSTLITLTLGYEGFTDGVADTITKTIYPTISARIPFDGTGTTQDIVVSGTDVIVYYALDNWVYAGCSGGIVNISAGAYTVGVNTNNSATGFVVTNSVTGIPYPTPKVNYTVPVHGLTTLFDPYTLQKDTSGNFEVRVYADNNEFVDCVKVTATGRSSLVTQTITAVKQVSDKFDDAFKFPEYIATIPYGSYTQGEYIDVTPVVYPKVGDTPLDFSALGYSMPTAKPCTHSIICDKNGSYGYTVAVVDPLGNDLTGEVVTFDAFNSASPPAAFLTRGAAYQAIYAYNGSNYRRTDDAGGGLIYMQAGTYDAWGQSHANRNNTSNMITAPFPGVAKADVIFDACEFDDRGPDTFDVMSNVTINIPDENMNTTALYVYADNLVFYNCDIDIKSLYYTAASPGALTIIGGNISRIGQGLLPNAGSAYSLRLRGFTCTHNSTRQLIESEIAVGCDFDNVTIRLRNNTAGVVRDGGIFCYNRIVSSDDRRLIDMNLPSTNGFAINNNIIIQQTDVELLVEPTVFIGADNSEIDAYNDFMFCNNTVPGSQRCNVFYNDYNLAGVGPGPRLLNRVQNNLYGTMNFITDDDDHGGGALDATDGERYGNHALVHGTWNSGNYGVGINRNTTPPDAGHKNRYVIFDWEYAGFVDDKVGHPGETATGYGDYHLAETSGAIGWPFEKVLDYDLDGNLRSSQDDAGAYVYYIAPDPPDPPGPTPDPPDPPGPTPDPTPTPTPEPEDPAQAIFEAVCLVDSLGNPIEWGIE